MNNVKTRAGFAGLFALGMMLGGNAMATDPAAQKDHDKTESAQPVTDTWITTKVKTDLLATKDVSGMEIKVDTKDGVVKLEGTVSSKAEVDRAIAAARSIEGVKKVDSSMLKVAGRSTP